MSGRCVGSNSWLCPNLQRLHIEGCCEEFVLLDMVNKRTHAAVLDETGATVNGIVRLRELRLLGETENMVGAETVGEIRRILGPEGECIWLSKDGDEVEVQEEGSSGDEFSDYSAEEPNGAEGSVLGLCSAQAMDF